METILGAYQDPDKSLFKISAKISYDARPVHRHKMRDDLFQAFKERNQNIIDAKKTQIDQLRSEYIHRLDVIRSEYRKKRIDVKTDKLIRKKRPVYANLKERRVLSIQELKAEISTRRLKIHNDAKVFTWQEFLINETRQGNQVALEVLRSRKKKTVSNLNSDIIQGKSQDDGKIFEQYKHEVRKNGDIVYQIGIGVKVRDEGEQLKLEGLSKPAVEAITKMAVSKYEKAINVSGTDEFKEAVVQCVVKNKLEIRFSDQKMEASRKAKRKGLIL